MLGLTVHPETGQIWESENGPLGGDEVNVLTPGGNYGWLLLSWGRHYSGARVSREVTRPGFEDPELVWVPSIAISGMTFYTGTGPHDGRTTSSLAVEERALRKRRLLGPARERAAGSRRRAC